MNFRILFGILLISTVCLLTSGSTTGGKGLGESIGTAISYFFRKLVAGVPRTEQSTDQPSLIPKKTYTYDDLPAINARYLYPSLTQYPNSGFDYQSKLEPSKTDNKLVMTNKPALTVGGVQNSDTNIQRKKETEYINS